MISYIKGTIIEQNDKYIIILAGNIGYKIHTPYRNLEDHKNDISLYTYLAVRENSLDLYGFERKTDLDFFELLLTVSGIGPKSAISILSNCKTEIIVDAIQKEDPSLLTKTSGISKKNAEKIVLELKNKVTNFKTDGVSYIEDDIMDALLSLGYSERQIKDIIKKVEGQNTSEKIKSALKYLNK